MWCMFGNSALLGFAGTLRAHDLSWFVFAAGFLITLFTLLVQVVTFGAEQEAIDRGKEILARWKGEVPQVRTLLYDTPAGGNSERRHRRARLLMGGVLYTLLGLWAVLALERLVATLR